MLGFGSGLGGSAGRVWVLRAAVSAAVVAAAVVVVGSSVVWAAAPVFPTADNDPVVNESATVTLLAGGEGQTKVGPPVRAVDEDAGDSLEYSLSDGDPLHASFFSIDSSNGQISMNPDTRSGVYRVRVSVSDDGFDSDDSDTATVDVVIHVTSPGHYPWEDAWVHARSMTARGETAYDRLGWWMDATSEVVVVSAYEAGPSRAGAVYVFDPDSGAQLAKLTSPNAQNDGQFGLSVAVGGDTIFVGTWAEGGGRVYVFVKPDGGWADTSTATATLTATESAFACGIAASDDGNTLAAGICVQKGAYVFTKPAGGWADTTAQASGVKLTAGTRHADAVWHGITMDVSGDGSTIAVSASYEYVNGIARPGAVYVYTKPETGWAATASDAVVARLTASDPTRYQELGFFGTALSYDGSTMVASAAPPWRKGEDDHPQMPDDDYGSAYVYVRPSGGWTSATETAKLAAGFGHQYDAFGRGVAISPSGDRIAVGNSWSRSSNYRGSAYVYTKPAGGWSDDLDGAGDNLRVLTLADADTNPKHRYGFGGRGLAFIGENKLVVGQSGYVEALAQKDELTTLPDGGLYGANRDLSMTSERLPGSAHLFTLRQAQRQQQPAAPPPPPPPPPDDETAGPDDGTDTPDEPPPPPEFADVDEESAHAQSIEKAAALGITAGTTDRTFSPSEPVTRAQMATFLARTWEASGRECTTSGAMSFDDVASGSTHAAGIDCMSALGITAGTTDRTFSPSEPVTRAQMATFLARAWEAAGRECSSAAAGAFFDDVPADSAHAAGIACMAALGIARGTAAGAFSPSETVTRAQMATFLARFHQALTA